MFSDIVFAGSIVGKYLDSSLDSKIPNIGFMTLYHSITDNYSVFTTKDLRVCA